MFSVRLYIRIFCQVTAILFVAGLGITGIITGKAILLGIVALFIAAWLIYLLVSYLNVSNRRIQLFLDAMEDDESMLFFPENTGNEEQRRLYAAFNRISLLMTESKRRNFERELHRKEYESWDKLMHVLTHEIMNSIAPIVSLSGTLLTYFRVKQVPKNPDELTDATIRKTIRGLDTIKSQGQHLMSFTDSYRRFASLQQPVPKVFSLTDQLQNLQLLFQTDLRRMGISLTFDLFRPEIEIEADEQMLSQVLINLLKNAMQSLENLSDAHICLRVGRNENELSIAVSDNGAGIPADLFDDIFVPFFTTRQQGTGIGLSLSRQIIRMHGGDLKVTSQPYAETCFIISLPIKSLVSPDRECDISSYTGL